MIPASSGFDHHSAQKDTAHFPAIKKELGIPYSEMLFFDDESPNVSKVIRWTTFIDPTPGSSNMILIGKADHWRNASSCGTTLNLLTSLWQMQVARLGVTSILVPSGMSVDILQKGLEQHAKK